MEREFLNTLATILPISCQPIIRTDAGFRRPWFRVVAALDWDYIGRVRGLVRVQPLCANPDHGSQWVSCTQMHEQALPEHTRAMGTYRLGRRQPLSTQLIVHRAAEKGRQAKTVHGKRRQDTSSEQAARSAQIGRAHV